MRKNAVDKSVSNRKRTNKVGASTIEQSELSAPSSISTPSKSSGDFAGWHLGATPRELAFAQFQHALICLSEAFYRNIGRNLAQLVGDTNLNGQDSVLLQVIQSTKRAKTVTDLLHFTNRTDVANIQYSVRKLERAGLIERAASEGKGANYRPTKRGTEIARAYAEARRELLSRFPEKDESLFDRLESARDLMVILAGLYDHDTRQQMTRMSVI